MTHDFRFARTHEAYVDLWPFLDTSIFWLIIQLLMIDERDTYGTIMLHASCIEEQTATVNQDRWCMFLYDDLLTCIIRTIAWIYNILWWIMFFNISYFFENKSTRTNSNFFHLNFSTFFQLVHDEIYIFFL